MPNWCHNELKINGDYEELFSFYNDNLIENEDLSLNTDKKLDFSFCVAVPLHIDEKETAFWAVENWGTKWNSLTDYYNLDKENSSLHISFETAWTPPIKWLEKAQIRYPKLKFYLSYYEEGMQFKGVAKSVKGKVVNKVKEIK